MCPRRWRCRILLCGRTAGQATWWRNASVHIAPGHRIDRTIALNPLGDRRITERLYGHRFIRHGTGMRPFRLALTHAPARQNDRCRQRDDKLLNRHEDLFIPPVTAGVHHPRSQRESQRLPHKFGSGSASSTRSSDCNSAQQRGCVSLKQRLPARFSLAGECSPRRAIRLSAGSTA